MAGAFHDVAEFKKLLVAHKDDFGRVLASRILAYACGRRVEALDRRQVESVAHQAAARGYGFRDLVEAAVLSDQFRAN